MKPRRIAVVGNSGSGKTTVAQEISRRLGCVHIELDSIHHLEDWTPIDPDDMRLELTERMEANDRWVVDGNYQSLVQDLVFDAADTVVWLDLPRRVVIPRIARRTIGRMALRRELWNGNRERFRNLFNRNPEDNIILWSWTRDEKYRKQYSAAREDPTNHHLDWVRLRSPAEVKAWLRAL